MRPQRAFPRPAISRKKGSEMCSPVRCRTCGKVTWSGCGDHVDDIKVLVPDELWCDGHHEEQQPDSWTVVRQET
jgi:hypothetical protein